MNYESSNQNYSVRIILFLLKYNFCLVQILLFWKNSSEIKFLPTRAAHGIAIGRSSKHAVEGDFGWLKHQTFYVSNSML